MNLDVYIKLKKYKIKKNTKLKKYKIKKIQN